MSAKFKEKKVMVQSVVGYVCDCCNKEFIDDMDTQEFLHYRNTGGYSSVFGDGAVMGLDLCQDCVKKLLGEFMQFNNDDEFDGIGGL